VAQTIKNVEKMWQKMWHALKRVKKFENLDIYSNKFYSLYFSLDFTWLSKSELEIKILYACLQSKSELSLIEVREFNNLICIRLRSSDLIFLITEKTDSQ
jgi:hypothetical protein